MTTTRFTQITEDEFAARFRPIRNHINTNASFDWGDGYGTLFETYGDEFEFVRKQNPEHVWTLLSGDDGDYIGNGSHFVNRLGYFVCLTPVRNGDQYEVTLEVVESGWREE